MTACCIEQTNGCPPVQRVELAVEPSSAEPRSNLIESREDYVVAEAVKAFDGCFRGVTRQAEMLDAFRYQLLSDQPRSPVGCIAIESAHLS